MAKLLKILAASLLTLGIGLAYSQASFAQLKEGCGVDLSAEQRAAMQGSEEGSGAPGTGVGGGEVAAEEHAAMQGSAEGSGAPMPGRGECDDIDKLPQAANTEG